jgi:hypothetical protein
VAAADEHEPPPDKKFFAAFPRPTPVGLLFPSSGGAGGEGRPRRVPRLVSANKIPFVRYKRRQPAGLSRMLSKLQRQEIRVHDVQARLWKEVVPVAAAEDEWDGLMARLGVGQSADDDEEGEEEETGETGFLHDAVQAARRADQDIRDMFQRRQVMIERMGDVVRREAELAEKERVERRERRRAERESEKRPDRIDES